MINRKKKLRDAFNEVSGFCGYCGKEMNYNAIYSHDAPTIDHIIPQCRGGKTDRYNTICVCYQCNQTKADRTLAEFMSQLKRGIK